MEKIIQRDEMDERVHRAVLGREKVKAKMTSGSIW